MIDDVRNITNKQVTATDTGYLETRPYTPSMQGNPNAVDKTPTADTYQPRNVGPSSVNSASGSPLEKAAYIIPTWLVLNEGTNLFNKACGGEYEKSLVGRLGAFGDKVSNSKLVQNSFVDKMRATGSTIKKNIQAFIDKRPMLSAMDKTPTLPENSMPKNFMETQAEADIKEAASKLKDAVEKPPKSLKAAGASKAEIDALKSKYGTDMFGRIKNSKLAVQEYQLTKLGGPNMLQTVTSRQKAMALQFQKYDAYLKTLPKDSPLIKPVMERMARIQQLAEGYPANTVKNLKIKTMGLNKATFEAIQTDPVKAAKQLESALGKGKSFLPKLSESFNKIKCIHAPKTKLGKFFPKLAKLGMRGLTFGGGTFNTLFIALMMGSTVKNMFDAPKEQKAGTIASGLLETLSWVVSMPLALGAMHKVGGIQYTGLGKAGVEKFRAARDVFNARVKAGEFIGNKALYDSELAAVKALKKAPGKQGIFTKAMKGVAKFLGIGLEQFNPYKEATQGLKGGAKFAANLRNIGRKMPNFLRNCVGYPLRFGLYMFAFAPIVDKLFSGVTHAIFGKPYDPEEIKAEKEKEAARLAELYPGPSLVGSPEAAKYAGTTDLNSLSNKNLVKQRILGVKSTDADPVQGGYNNVPFMPPVQPQG